MPAGRPTEYQGEASCQKAFTLCQGGATDFEVAQEFGIHVRTLYLWKAAHPEFAQAMKLGKELPDDRAEATFYRRAVGYEHTVIKIVVVDGAPCSVPYTEAILPDVGALQQWLANRRKDKWKFRQSHEHSGPDGAPIPVKHTVADDMNDDELARIAAQARPQQQQQQPDAGGSSTAPSEPKAGSS